MAGLGGLFNYEKPGAGVDKNGPQKKGIALFWEIYSEKFWKLISLNFLYILLCIPVVTIGLADVGMTYITRNFVRRKPVMLKDDFFETIKKNWKQALAVGLINTLATAAMIFGILFYFFEWNQGLFQKAGFIVLGIFFVMFTFLKYYINFLVVTFNLRIKQLYKNSMLLSSAGVKANLIITLSSLGLFALFFAIPLIITLTIGSDLPVIIFLILAILFMPATISMIIQFNIFPIIKKHMIDPYYEQNPEAAERDKALLNIFENEEEESEGEETEAVFKDMGTKEAPVSKTEPNIPKQYSKRDLKRLRREQSGDVDDDTI